MLLQVILVNLNESISKLTLIIIMTIMIIINYDDDDAFLF